MPACLVAPLSKLAFWPRPALQDGFGARRITVLEELLTTCSREHGGRGLSVSAGRSAAAIYCRMSGRRSSFQCSWLSACVGVV